MGAPPTHLMPGMSLEAPAGGVVEVDGDRAEAAVRACVLARVIAGVVHDMRTPLGTMMMKLQLLRDALAGEAAVSESVAGHLRVLDGQVERMTEMLRRVANTVEPPAPLGWLDAGALIGDVAGALAYEAKSRSVELVVEPRAGAVRTGADPAAVGALVLSLLGRALAGTREGGRMVARAALRDGTAVVELDRTPGDPDVALGYDLEVLVSTASALGGRLERGPGDPGFERLTLTMPGNERT